MRGIFSLLSVFAMLIVACTGAGVFWLSHSTLQNAKQDSAAALAMGIAYDLSSQMQLFNHAVEQIAVDEDVVLAVESADPTLMEKAATKVEKFVPNAMKVRLLPATVDAIDESAVPHMGYADLDMIKRTLTDKQPAIIQGEGDNRHLAITAAIKKDNQVIGVVLASLKFDFIKATLDQSHITEHFVEVSQSGVVLGVSGDVGIKNATPEQISITNTAWQIQYWSGGARDFVDISLIIGVVVLFGLIVGGILFYGYYQTTMLLKKDQNKVLEAVKDLMTGKELGGYQVNLTEMQIIISTLAQFKRILDNKQSRNTGNHEQVKLDDRDMLDLPDISASTSNKKSFVNALKKKK